MTVPPNNFEDFYQKLRASYLTRLGGSIAVIDNILSQSQLRPLDRDSMEQAMQLAHGLAGSGTTFGFPQVTAAGQQIDVFLSRSISGLQPDGVIASSDLATLEPMLYALRVACVEATDAGRETEATLPAGQRKNAAKGAFNVLIIDDDAHLPALLGQRLQQKNIRVSLASDGSAGLAQIQQQRPDLIVLDIEMPGLSGHEILRRLKQDPDFVAVPILMLTGKARQEDVVSALHAGAIDYVIKPVDFDKLVARIEKILDAARFTVLIADNDPLILQLLESKFRNQGFRVALAEDGKRAWSMILSQLPDIVILDRMMPGLEGLAILDAMRKEEATKSIPTIILSARKNERDIEQGLSHGAQAYMAKPFIPEELINRCLALLKADEIAA